MKMQEMRNKLRWNGKMVFNSYYEEKIKTAKKLERKGEVRIKITTSSEYDWRDCSHYEIKVYTVTPTRNLKGEGTIKGITLYQDYTGWISHGDTCGKVKDATFDLREDGTVLWYGGDWLEGTWGGGTWSGGTWHQGTWEKGLWKRGVWKDGTWEDGTWIEGTWEDGEHLGGTWKNGTWKNGVWREGTWEEGTKEGGIWY